MSSTTLNQVLALTYQLAFDACTGDCMNISLQSRKANEEF